MKRKKLYLILPILVLVVFFATVLLSMGCKEDPEIKMNREMAEQIRKQQEAKAEEAEQLAIDKQVRQDEAEQRALDEAVDQMEREEWAEDEEEEAAKKEEEEKIISNEPITYTGGIEGVEVTLIVNFITTEVTGLLIIDENNIDATVNGEIKIDTFEVTSKFSGNWWSEEDGEGGLVIGTITGTITDDLSRFINGTILPEKGNEGIEFTATRK